MLRLFVGIEFPPETRLRLSLLCGGVTGARWVDAGNLHLTLRFIGEVDRLAAQDIAAALGRVHGAPFTLALGAPGSFDTRGITDNLWIGVTPQDAIKALNQRIEQALARVGIAPETRAFLPHITLARLNRSAGAIDGFLARVLPATTFEVAGFALYESTLGGGGSNYEIVGRYRL